MKKIILLGFCLLAFGANAQSVGINSNGNTADPSAILDLESTTKGFLPPRMTQLQMNAIVSPATGLIVYCTNCSPAGLNHFDGTAWSSLTGSATQQTLAANCLANGFTGVFISGSNVSGTHFSVTLTNNSFSATSFPISPSDLVLSGASAGVSVNNLSLTPGGNYITTVNIPAYQTVTVYYGLTGVPATGGLLTGTWTKFSLTCTASTTVGNLSDNVSSTYCGNASTNGFYAATLPMQTTNTFVIAITNNSGSSINLAAPTAANLSLSYSGTASPSLAVGTPTQSSTGALAAGATRTFTYPLTGTPTSIGTLTFNWTYGDLTCTKTREIDAGASNFASTYCNSGALNGTYSSMIALTAANTFTVSINNTSGVTTPTLPAANAGNLTLSGPGAAGLTITTATPAASTLTAGGNRTYTYTISGTPTGTGTLTATWNYLGMTCSKEVTIPALSNSVSANCAAATTNGYYATTLPMQTTNTFVIAITNTGSTALNLVAPTAANLSLNYSGTASPAFAVGTTTQSSTGALAAGATRTFTYRITGTPTSIGTLTFDWAYGDLTCTKTREIDLGESNFASTYCNTGAFNGTYSSMIAMTAANTFTVTINNTSGATTPTLPAANSGNLTLSGPGAAGLTVTTATPGASTLTAGGNRTYTYTISGTPTGTGTLTATWNYLGMTCSKEVTIPAVSNAVTANCASATANGFYFSEIAMQTGNTFTISITNTGSTALNLVAPTPANLSLSYTGSTSPAFAVSSATQSTTGALAAGATRTYTYVLTGTPTSIGTLTFNWTYGDLTCSVTKEIGLGASLFANTYCNSGALNGTYSSMIAMTAANTFTVTINNTSGATTPTLPAANAGNLTLSGPGAAGLTVTTATPAASTLTAGGNRTYTYTISGTPTGTGTLTATWNYLGMTCSKEVTMPALSNAVSANCAAATTNGFYAATLPMQTTNTFVIAITNTGSTALNLVAPTAANLSLSYSGTASPAFAVGTTTQSSTGALAAGATRTFTYRITGTPTSIGTLTFDWAYGDLTCTKTKEIDAGASNFASTYCNSGALNGTYSSMIAMTAANTFTVTINNTSGATTPTLPAANAGNLTLSGPGAAGLTVTTATPAASTLTAGGNRTYTYTISGTPTGTGTLTATWNYLGMTCSKDVTIPALSNAVTANCASATANGFYFSEVAMQTGNTFVISITNTGSTALNLVAPTAANLSLSYSGTASPALAVGTTTQSSTGALAAGATRTFTYVLTGTPTSIGTLTFNWTYGDLTCSITKEIGLGASLFANTYCNSGAFNGTYSSMIALTAANTFTITINNSSGATTPTLPAANAGNLTLSGPGAAGLTITTATPAASTLTAGGNRTYTYTISGTPTGTGTLTATWNYLGMTCSKEVTIPALSNAVSANCAAATTNGYYATTLPMQTTNTFVIAITNTGSTALNLVAPTAANLSLSYSGTASPALAVGTTTQSSTGALAAGATRTFTYRITGTPTSIGTLTFDWAYGDLTCTKTREIDAGASNFASTYCNTSALNGTYASGGITTASNTFTVIINNVSGATTPTLPAATAGNLTLSGSGAAGLTVSAASPAASTLAAGGSRTYTYTISGTITGTGTLIATWNYPYLGMTCSQEVEVISVVSLPNICNPSNPTAVVDVINASTGKVWMDRNLGATSFATNSSHKQSYGSLYQWGRGSDGHQCVNRIEGDGVITSNVTPNLAVSDTPGHGNFIVTNTGNNDWRSPQNNNLWQGVSGTNNPCPTGYRLPTDSELNNERLSWVQAPISSTNDANGAITSPLKLPLAGYRSYHNGYFYNFYEDNYADGYYWSSTVNGTNARFLVFGSGGSGIGAYMASTNRANGFSVRCIKN